MSMSTYDRSVFEIFPDETRKQLEEIARTLIPWRGALPHISEMFPPEPKHFDGFGEEIRHGDTVTYAGTLYDFPTINRGRIDGFKDGGWVRVDGFHRSSRYGHDHSIRRVWVRTYKVARLGPENRPRLEEEM